MIHQIMIRKVRKMKPKPYKKRIRMKVRKILAMMMMMKKKTKVAEKTTDIVSYIQVSATPKMNIPTLLNMRKNAMKILLDHILRKIERLGKLNKS